MRSVHDFRPLILALWFRLMALAVVSLVFYEALCLTRGKAQGWSFYLRATEVAYEVLVRMVAASLAGLLIGTMAAAAMVPVLWYFQLRREQLVDRVTKAAVVCAGFVISRYMLITLIQWSAGRSSEAAIWWSGKSSSYMLVRISLAAFYVAFAAAMCFPHSRRVIVTSLDPALTPSMTRRTALVTIAGAAGLAVTEYAFSKRLSLVNAALVSPRPKSNFLLISFDALSAEDMSLYGYPLSTTPNIDAFARKATVFTNFFSASTFTTPAIATILTGLYPSESRVYHLQGRVGSENLERNFVHLLRAAGYGTGAFMSNPYAHFFVKDLQNDFDVLPEPTFQDGGFAHLWKATVPLHRGSGFGSRIEEYMDLAKTWNYLNHTPVDLPLRYPPEMSFRQASQILTELPTGFFLWVHVMAPHSPYLPAPADQGRFLPNTEPLTPAEKFWHYWIRHYEPNQQHLVDPWRLRYDEFVATADRTFGEFILALENSGRLQDTTVMLTADHGESFEGGVFQHNSADLTRPVIHVPLIIRTPGQKENHTVTVTADQTSIAPTILELAGLVKPSWMRGRSLVPWVKSDSPIKDEGLAFTQYVAKNSVFKPLRQGTFGVIDGEYEYIVHLATQEGELRPLNEAHIWHLDRTADNPGRAEALRTVLHERFPDVVQLKAPALQSFTQAR